MNASAPGASLQFLLNGRPVSVERPSVHLTLLDFLRERGLTGAKEGCAEGECGACTVVLVAPHGSRSVYRPVNSCLMLLPLAAGHEIYTVESLASAGKLADAQEAMAAAGGSQCGYCTPGFVMSLFAEHYRPDRQGPCDPDELGGNLCRCTGYRPIRDAALSLGAPPDGPFRERLSRPAPRLEEFDCTHHEARFSRPTSLDGCLKLLAADPSARLVAGATDLGVEANLRGRRWPHLISLEAIPEIREFIDEPDYIRIGAALPLNEIAARWHNAPQAFREWAPLFASPPIRNRATLGGNLATASPIGDGAPLLAALDASLEISGSQEVRSVPISSFFTGYRRTVLGAGELLTAIEIPKPLPGYTRFYKVAKRRVDDISTVAAGFAMDWDTAGRITYARFAFGGVAPIPLRVEAAENAILGSRWNLGAVHRVQEILERTLKPISDHRGSAEYRLAVAQSLVEKFWWERQEKAA